MENNGDSKAKKRNEAELGKQYERHIFALITLKCLLHPDIENFWVASNLADVEAYDDVILNVTYKNGSKELFLIQAKSKNGCHQPVVPKMFLREQKDLSLEKYQAAYMNIMKNDKVKDLVNYTDQIKTFFVILNNCNVSLKHGNENIAFKNLPLQDFRDFITTISFETCPGFRMEDKKQTFDEEFLENFYFYPQQLELNDIKQEIQMILSASKESTVGNDYIHYFFDHSLHSNYVQKINMLEIKLRLLKSSDMFGNFTPSSYTECAISTIIDTFKQFSFTLITEEQSENIIWGEIIYSVKKFYNVDLSHEDLLSYWNESLPEKYQESIIAKNSLLKREKDLNVKILYLFMVANGHLPFYKKTEQSSVNNNTLELLRKLNVYTVLYNRNRNQPIEFSKQHTVLRTMGDMDKETFDKTISKIYVSFRGKAKIPLSSLVPGSQIGKRITTDQFVQLYNKIVPINQDNFFQKEIYINRTLKTYLISAEVFTNINDVSYAVFNLPNGIKIRERWADHDDNFFYTTTQTYDPSFLNVFKSMTHTKLYIFQYEFTKAEIHYFTLLYSTSGVESLKAFLEHKEIDDDELLDTYTLSKINIICNNAGMGKSMLLRYLLQNFSAQEYVLYIELSKWSKQINSLENYEGFVNFLKDNFTQNENLDFLEASKHFLHWYINTGQLVLLIDDFEEIQEQSVLNIFKEAAEKGLRLWIVARPQLRKLSENTFGTLALELTEFSIDDQKQFFEKFFRKHKMKNIPERLVALEKSIKSFDTTIIGISQQTMMLATIFKKDRKARIKSTYDLYDKYINIVLEKMSGQYGKHFMDRTLSKLALTNVFSESVVSRVFDWDEFEVDVKIVRKESNKNLLIEFNKDSLLPIFCHKTYAEFLAAKWLSVYIKKQILQQTPFDLKTLFKKLYTMRLITVRWFLDRILIKDFQYNREIKTSGDCCRYKCDILGRNNFFYYMTYGKLFDIHTEGLNNSEQTTVIRENKEIFISVSEAETQIDEQNCADITSANTISESFDDCNQLKVYLPKEQKTITENTSLTRRYRRKSLESIYFRTISEERDNFLEKTAVEYSLLAGTLEKLENVLEHQFIYSSTDFSNLDDEKYFMLYYAAENGFYNIMKKLLDVPDLKKNVMMIKDFSSKMSLLHLAVKNGQTECVNQLLNNHPADEFGQDINENTALHLAVEQGDTHILRQVLIHSLDSINMKNRKEQTVLHLAVIKGNKQFVKWLLEQESDVNTRREFGITPLMDAARRGRLELVKLLLSNQADISNVDENGWTVLHHAVKSNSIKLINRLLASEVAIDAKNKKGYTALMEACANNSIKIFKLLLEKGASMTETDNNHWTVLHHAVKRNNIEIVQYLLNKKANINAKTKKDLTPLMIACRENLPDVVKILLENNANIPHFSKVEKTTALTICERKKYKECADSIKQEIKNRNAANKIYLKGTGKK